AVIGEDPLLANPAAGDYHLQSNSPAIAAGTPASPAQRDFDERCYTSPPAIGAFEFTTPCPADLDADGAVTGADLANLLGSWGPNSGPADLNNDGMIGAPDLADLLGAWGPCP
ncbi:MAG: hypothetical protein VYC34_10410, partial [Planctomycetota bacterium]|nr:hypothetical protein [Planctomycetota bacterium]